MVLCNSWYEVLLYVDGVMQVEAILDKENFTLEELLDEEEVIQECKALNSRLINLYIPNQFEIMEFYFSCP